MTRTQRLVALALFIVSVMIVLAVLGIAGAFGPVELLFAIIIAVPITVGIYRIVDRRLISHR